MVKTQNNIVHRHVADTGQEQFELGGSGLSLQQQQRPQVTHKER